MPAGVAKLEMFTYLGLFFLQRWPRGSPPCCTFFLEQGEHLQSRLIRNSGNKNAACALPFGNLYSGVPHDATCNIVQVSRVHVAHATKSHKGRWRGMDAGADMSDDQVSNESS